MGILPVCALVVLAVLMLSPFIISASDHQTGLSWYKDVDMTTQSMVYSFLRAIAFPNMSDLQSTLLSEHGLVGSFLVVFIGETLGSVVQLLVFDNIVAPLAAVRGKPRVEFLASALRRQPFLYPLLLQLTGLSVLASYTAPFVLGCIGDSDLLPQFVGGCVVGQVLNLALQVSVLGSLDWGADYLQDAAIPCTRIVSTLLICYWLWQEARAVATGGGKLPEPAVTNVAEDVPTDEPADVDADAGAKTEAPVVDRRRSALRMAASASAAVGNAIKRTGTRASARVLRFQEGPPTLVGEALKSLTPPRLRSNELDDVPARVTRSAAATPKKARMPSRTPKKDKSTASAAMSSPVPATITRSLRGRSVMSAPVEPEEESMATVGSVGGGRSRSKGHKHQPSTLQHRLETTLTDKVYSTPSRRSKRLSEIGDD